MMITIHNLPVSAKYQEVKLLIKQVCNVREFILDNIATDDNGHKKVKVGVMNEADGEIVLNCLDGYRMGANILRAEPMGKPANLRLVFASKLDVAKQKGLNPHYVTFEFQQQSQNFNNVGGIQPQNNFNNYGQEEPNWGPGPSQWQANHPGPNQLPGNFHYKPPEPEIIRDNLYGQQQMPHRDALGYGQQTFPNAPQQGTPYPAVNTDMGFLADSRQLRSVEIINEPMKRPIIQERMPPNNQGFIQKPHTIMKDNFQGPQYIQGQQPQAQVSFQNQPVALSPWAQPTPQQTLFPKSNQPLNMAGKDFISPSGRQSPHRYSPDRFSPRRFSPSRKDHSPRRYSPGRKGSPGRRFSPGRKGSPARRFSPKRKGSPGRRFSPGRKDSPSRRFSPGRKEMPSRRSSDRRFSPEGRRYSPGRRGSPGDTRGRRSPTRRSPGRRPSPKRDTHRFSPPRHNKTDKEPTPFGVKAPNQAMYSGGYRPKEDQYPRGRDEPKWQRNNIPDGDKNFDREPKFVGNFDQAPRHSRLLDDSPSRRSPRRSWALEKRSSPIPSRLEPPPPPIWPGHDDNFPRDRPKSVDNKRPIWEPPINIKKEKSGRDEENRDYVRGGFRDKDLSPRRHDRSPHRFERDSPRRHSPDRSNFRPFESGHRSELPSREELGRREEYSSKKVFMYKNEEINKDFEDIYKRAQEFRKKTEELKEKRHSEDRRHEDGGYEMERRRNEPDMDRHDYRRFDVEPARNREVPTFEGRPKSRDDIPRNESRRDPDWVPHKILDKKAKFKRDKAVDDLSKKIVSKRWDESLDSAVKSRIMDEMRYSVIRILDDMFGADDVSYIEMIIKFDAKFNTAKQDKLFDDVMSCFPKNYNKLKRPATDVPETVTKSARIEHKSDLNTDLMPAIASNAAAIADWQTKINNSIQSQALQMQIGDLAQIQMMMQTHAMFQQSQGLIPNMMLPDPNIIQPTMLPSQIVTNYNQREPETCHNLYLCKDDFEPFASREDGLLKQFLVSEILKATHVNNGWTPDFTFKGLQSLCRYELFTADDASKDWLLNVDFSQFKNFNVLVYTKEELWYERAAVWLPGHSRCRNIEPLEKLRLQNQSLQDLNIGKWKQIKKIVTPKGTRVYVDMPPSSARALEKHNMILSYELQPVNVYTKAVAVDKEAFDVGVKEQSDLDPSEIAKAIQNSSVPILLKDEPNVVKISIKGSKSITIQDARKIKEMIIHHIFKTNRARTDRKTDFLKFGMCGPVFGIVPANSETRRWLMRLDIGKINKQDVEVIDRDVAVNMKLFKMYIRLPQDGNSMNLSQRLALERLKNGNKGVKGLNFQLWQLKRMKYEWRRPILEVMMDIESVETILTMDLKLDYIDNTNSMHTCVVRPGISLNKLKDEIEKRKAELDDKYEVANMDIESSEDDDVVYIGGNKILTFKID